MPNTRTRAARLPTLPKLPGPPRPQSLPGAINLPRNKRVTRDDFLGYPDPPADWVNSLAEWVVFWRLTTFHKMKRIGPDSPPVEGRTFFYQVSIPALGIFTKTESTRVDFLIPQGGGQVQTIAIDPYNNFTHADEGLDMLKRQVLLQQEQILLIWIETAALEAGQFSRIDDALMGSDTSARNLGR